MIQVQRGVDGQGVARRVLVDEQGRIVTSGEVEVSTAPASLTPLGYEQITDLSAATGLTVPEGASFALIQAEGQDIRWRDDGTDPTDTVGMLITADAAIWYTGDLAAFAAIEVATGASLNVNYYG